MRGREQVYPIFWTPFPRRGPRICRTTVPIWAPTAPAAGVVVVSWTMAILLSTPAPPELPAVAQALGAWQVEGCPVQLHPGDLGWAWQIGAPALVSRLRTWSRGGRTLAVGFQDGASLLRMAIDPELALDAKLAEQLAADVADPRRGVLPAGEASVEARFGETLRQRLKEDGWSPGELWTSLERGLAQAVEDPGLRIEVVTPELAQERVAVQNASFGTSRFTEERWHTMAAGPLYAQARCLLAYDGAGRAVATATVWSAGRGRPGLIEPMGVHRAHRGKGYGQAITVASALFLRRLGASTAVVCAETANKGAVATYCAAGFRPLPVIADFQRGRFERAPI